jgi:hypothetical protein
MVVLQLLAAGHHPKWSGEELSLLVAQHARNLNSSWGQYNLHATAS